MAEFKLVISSVFVILTLPLAAGGSVTTMSVSVGEEVTLLCHDAKDVPDRCNSTTWIFCGSGSKTAVTLFEYGAFHSDSSARSHRLNVTANCSLVLTEVTPLDQGCYTCRHFISGQQVSESMVVLSVFNAAGTPPSNSTSNVTRGIFSGKDTTNATRTTTTAKPKSTRPTSTPTPARTTTAHTIKPPATASTTKSTAATSTKSDTTTTIMKSITTTTTTTSLMTKTKTRTTIEIKTISPDTITITKSNTTTITLKSPTNTTTFNSTTTVTTIKPAGAAGECRNAVQFNTMLIIVASGFGALFIMMAVIIWQMCKRNKPQMSDNIEQSQTHCLGPQINLERVHSEHNQANAVSSSSSARLSYTSTGASTDSSSIYATMKRI